MSPTGKRSPISLAGHAGGDKPEIVGDSAYGDAATRADPGAGLHGDREMPARAQRGRTVLQGPVHHRPAGRNGYLPGREHRRHRRSRARWPGIVPALVRGLPAAISVHRLALRPQHRHPPARGRLEKARQQQRDPAESIKIMSLRPVTP